ncbi:ABC transporter substrate-binding protein [Paenibacillus sp. Root52]|uniref:Iron complex transport system substrate-binding protein n=1 Tax=Paenibacillus amylolyticus TaxID=1451 RepID=A0AAP5LMG9_PAEAM|nr:MULTISPECIES: ABC transporter substrate-binding protein [Paenibacillus]KQY84236.1 ABC transporter substrate-binding protein [Paenibacillus sp. Root52]MDR6724176.1 iron complex transport system substrate-binding protein [Paenibacillus amylolyticus]
MSIKNWKSVASLLSAAALALALAGCGNATTNEGSGASQQPAQEQSQEQTTTDLKTQYPITVTDATGETFTFEKAPAKIVSVSPAETESLFALGLDEQIVGVSDFDDYPEAATTKPKMGGVSKPNEESIIAADADIVFTGISMNEEAVKKFRDLGIVIFKTDPKSVDDVAKNIETFGQITDTQEKAQEIIAKMKQDVTDVTEAVKAVKPEEKKNVYVEFSPGWTVGKGEFMDELITLAGGNNVASDLQGWNEINEENIIAANPDVILYANDVIDENSKTLDQIIKARSGWDQITAVKDDAVIGLDANLLSRPGPRVTEGLKAVAKAIYPDLFQ